MAGVDGGGVKFVTALVGSGVTVVERGANRVQNVRDPYTVMAEPEKSSDLAKKQQKQLGEQLVGVSAEQLECFSEAELMRDLGVWNMGYRPRRWAKEEVIGMFQQVSQQEVGTAVE